MSSRLFTLGILAACLCPVVPAQATVTYSGTGGVGVNIFNGNSQGAPCSGCHPVNGRQYDTYANATALVNSAGYGNVYNDVVGNTRVQADQMPATGIPMTAAEKSLLSAWVSQRAGATAPPNTALPQMTTGSSSSVTAYAATLGATGNGGGASTSYYFDYGTTAGYGSTSSTTIPADTGGGLTQSASFSRSISGLACGTLYHFRVRGSNSVGAGTAGSDSTFTTSTCPGVTGTTGSLTLTEKQSFSITVNTTGGVTTYQLIGAPAGMTISAGGVISWPAASTPDSPKTNTNYPFTVRVGDGITTSDYPMSVTVTPVNDAPVITSFPATTANESTPYVYSPVATDIEGDVLAWSLTTGPAGMSINPSTGQIAWTPPLAGSNYTQNVTVTVTDNGSPNLSTPQGFVISVSVNSNPPVITSSPPTTATEHQPYHYQVAATDPKGNPMTYSLVSAPTGMVISAGGLVSWTPGEGVTTSGTVTVNVNDGFYTTPQSFAVTVTPVNDPPTITSTAVMTATEHQAYSYQATATDPENNVLTWILVTAPAGMTINSSTGLVQWTPPEGVAASVNVTVKVTDNGINPGNLSVTQSYVIAVTLVNDPPVITSAAVTTARQYQAYSYQATATDPENNVLTWTLVTAPTGMTIGSSTGLVQWTPPAGAPASVNVTVKVTDNGINPASLSATQSYTIAVTRVPVVTPDADVSVTATAYYTPVALSKATAVDEVDGSLLTTADKTGPFRPGTNVVTWSATNSAGTTATATQRVIIKPLVTLGGSEVAGVGQTVYVPVRLNGVAPSYPVVVTFAVSGGTAGTDYTVPGTTLQFNTSETLKNIPLTLINNGVAPDKTLLVTLTGVSAGSAVPGNGSSLTHRILVTTQPAAPTLSLQASQHSEIRQLVYLDDGDITVSALAGDPGGGPVAVSWSNGALSASILGATEIISTNGLAAGTYTIGATAVGAASLGITRSIVLVVSAHRPTLTAADTDTDGVPDSTEGLVDSNGNGLLDYLEAEGGESPESILLHMGSGNNLLLMAVADSGLRMSAGRFALAAQSAQTPQAGIQVFDTQVALGNTVMVDTDNAAIGAIYDFEVSGLSVVSKTAHVVLPLPLALPPGAQWRELSVSDRWTGFVATGGDEIRSAQRVNGQCPAPQDVAYAPGLIAGNDCIQLTITDGGVNDADGLTNGVVRVTAAPAVSRSVAAATAPTESQSGGALDLYTLLLLAVAVLVLRRKEQAQ